MARISGVTLPSEKQVWIALTYIHGIGRRSSANILSAAKVDGTIRVKNLTDDEIGRIQEAVQSKYTVEGELQRIVSTNIKRLKEIKAYRGIRHQANLPVRGQRTRTNARTKRGRRVTVGGTAKKAPAKT